MNIIPSIVEKTYSGNISYDLYSKLLDDRIVFVSGEINAMSSNIIISELLYLDSISHDDICMYINSPGGSVTDGLAIYDTMNYVKSDISTIVIGMAASMASVLLANGKKGKRFALPNSEVMIHEVLGGTKGQATEIKIEAERILKTRDKLNKILAKLTGNTFKKVSNDTKRDKFMTADEALDYGLIDEIKK